MGLLDSLGMPQGGNGLFDMLGSIFGPSQANAQPGQAPPPQAPAVGGQLPPQAPQFGSPPMTNGLGGRLLGALGGFVNGGSPIGGALNAITTLATGEMTDPNAVARTQRIQQYQSLQRDWGLSEPQARMIVSNPALLKEYFKTALSPGVTVGPDGSMVQQLPFGRLNVAGAFPVGKGIEVTNPNGSKSPGFQVSPSLADPNGRIALPTMPGQQPQVGAAPPARPAGPRPAAAGVPSDDPTMSLSPRQIAEANRPVITEQGPAAIAEQKATGEGLATDYAEIRKRSDGATKRLQTLQRMSQLSPNAYEGAGAPGVQYARSLLATFGFDPGKVPAGEEFTALANKLTLDANNGSLGTGVSNADVAYIAAMNPNIAQTREGREQIVETMRAIAKREQEVGKMAYIYKQRNGGSLDGFSSALAEWSEQNPLFSGGGPVNSFGERFAGNPQGATPTTKVRRFNPATGKIE